MKNLNANCEHLKNLTAKIPNAILDADRGGWTDMGNTVCPFNHSSNGGGAQELFLFVLTTVQLPRKFDGSLMRVMRGNALNGKD